MPQIHLLYGECDGHTVSIPSVTKRPDIYYALPLAHEDAVHQLKTQKARTELRAKLSTLAYLYKRTVRKEKVGWEYIYERAVELDKPPAAQPTPKPKKADS